MKSLHKYTPSIAPGNDKSTSKQVWFDRTGGDVNPFELWRDTPLIPTFLILPSASTSGWENFSLKAFTPANREESRAIAAILRSTWNEWACDQHNSTTWQIDMLMTKNDFLSSKIHWNSSVFVYYFKGWQALYLGGTTIAIYVKEV